MGRAAKSRRRAEKMKERNRIKAARQAQFASEAAAGKKRRTEGQMPRKLGRHPHGACPNIGCRRCSDQLVAPFGGTFMRVYHPRVVRKGRVVRYERWLPDEALHRRVVWTATGTAATVPADLHKRSIKLK